MAADISTIQTLIEEHIPDAEIRIEDLRGDGEHFAAYITSSAFNGKSRIEQHKMVHAALKGVDLHALAIQTSPKED